MPPLALVVPCLLVFINAAAATDCTEHTCSQRALLVKKTSISKTLQLDNMSLQTVTPKAVLGQQAVNGNSVSFPHSPEYAALNTGSFSLVVSVTATNDAHPRSYCPFYFSSSPEAINSIGLSIGHRQSKNSIEVRMADGGKAQVQTFKYPDGSISLNKKYRFELGCKKTSSARVCTVSVNGVASPSGSLSFACTGNIYGGHGGKFGYVWGWKFIGTLWGISFNSGVMAKTHTSKKTHASNKNNSSPSGARKKQFLSRRAVYVRWGSLKCPVGSKLLYTGFMANSWYDRPGGGFNYLCMHPQPQFPLGHTTANEDGALLYGVEYENTGALDKNHNRDAACAVCQWQAGGTTYVEWGHGEPRHNPSTATTCSKQGHEAIYTGLIMGTSYNQQKSEHICVDLERSAHQASTNNNDNGGLLYTTEMEAGSSDENAYPRNREVGCTVCGIPAMEFSKGTFIFSAGHETSVYTRWGSKTCAGNSRLIYEGFIAGSKSHHSGSGANSLCMTRTGAEAPSGFSDGNQDGNLLFGTEYQNTGALDKNHDGDAACVVCEYIPKLRDIYTQWGRQSCSNDHSLVYKGIVMGSEYRLHKSMHICVDFERSVHARSSPRNDDGNLLYSTEMEHGSSDERAYPNNIEVGCATCAASTGKTVFTRWGSKTCPGKSSLLYSGFMASSSHHQKGGGANTLCMHPSGEVPSGADRHNRDGNLLYGMEYQDTGAIKKNANKDAACAVCQLDRWEVVYSQWGRSETCTNGHQTLYSGYIMSNRYTENKGEFVCVDTERNFHGQSSNKKEKGGHLYATEMEKGSSDESKYPHNVEVGCSVCAALSEKDELPFAAQQGNAIYGQWVKLRSLHFGQEVTVGVGYEAASGTSSTKEETKESSYAHSWDVSVCFTATYGFGASGSSVGIEACAGYGGEETESVAKTTAEETSWDVSLSQTMEDTFSVPDALPDGTPEADVIKAHGVHLWQWQWTIVEKAENGNKEKQYKAKANSHFVYSPNDPKDGNPKRPCCMPGQEYGLWYPFNCKSKAGILKSAGKATHCRVGAPADSSATISSMTTKEITKWLDGLGLSQNYATKVISRSLKGPALAQLAMIVDKSAVASGDGNAVQTLHLVAETFDVGSKIGDAYIIMAALPKLLSKST